MLLVVVGGDGSADTLAFFLCAADYLADTGDVELLAICIVGNFVRLLSKYDACVVAAERKGVGNRVVNGLLALGVRNEIYIPCLFLQHCKVLVGVADCRRYNVLAYGLDGQHCFDGACRAQAVTCHGLGGAYGKVLVLVKQGVQRQELSLVVLCGSGSVGVDVVDVGELQTGGLHRASDGAHLSLSVGAGSGDVVRVRAYTGAEYLAVDLSAACLCVLVALYDKYACALAQGDAVAVVERGACVSRESVQRVESRERQRRKAVGAARNECVSLTCADKVGGIGKAHRARSAGVYDVGGRAVQPEVLRNVVCDGSSRHSEDIGRLCGAGLEFVGVVLVNACGAADAVADDNAYAVGIIRSHGVACVRKSLARRLYAQQGAAVVVLA